MVKPNIKILIKKHRNKLIIYGIGIISTIWLDSLLTPFLAVFNQRLMEKLVAPISTLIVFIASIFSIKIPVYSILLFIIIVWFIYKVSRTVMLNRRKFKILKAEYGSGATFIDITNRLNDLVIDDKLDVTLSNGIPGLDPTPGTLKVGKIKYQLNNQTIDKKYKERDVINLP